jgi:hypothetical protein
MITTIGAIFLYANTIIGEVARANVYHVPLISHSEIVRRRSRSLLDGSSGTNIAKQQIDALYQGYGTHYIDLWVGTPPQRQTVIVGTGSPKTSFPCSKCSDCGALYHTDGYFQEAESSTYHALSDCSKCTYGHCDSMHGSQCRLSTSYVEGSAWYGYESVDITYAGGPHSKIQKLPGAFSDNDKDDADPLRAQNFAFDHTFACQDEATGLFKTQMADGIMGMDNYPESFWRQAYDHGVIDKKAFALCLSRQENPTKMGIEAGALTMGGHDVRLHTSPMVYSKLDRSVNFVVRLKKMYLRAGGGGNSVLSSDPNLQVLPLDVSEVEYERYSKVIVDSGTTSTYFPHGLSVAFKALWDELSPDVEFNHEKMHLTEEEIHNLPTILLQLEGSEDINKIINEDPSKVPGLAANIDPNNPYDIIIAIPPTHYMEHAHDGQHGIYRAEFYVDERGYTATIGANTMMGHDILFDVEEGSLGFAESHCDYEKLEEEVAEEEEEMLSEKKDQSTPQSKEYMPVEKSGQKAAGEAESKSSLSRIFVAFIIAIGCFGVAHVGFNRFGGKEILARRHGRLSTEDIHDLELELQNVPRPIV